VLDLNRVFKITLIGIYLFSGQAFAQTTPGGNSEDVFYSRISEYFYNRSGRDVLSPVKLLGSVSKPGLYHIPDNTNLSTLLSISGGTTPDANTEGIIVRRADGTKIEKDLFKVVSGDEVKLAAGDMVYVPPKEGMFDAPSTNTIMVLTAVVSVVLTGILVNYTTRQGAP
jgi:hypothetical protein